MNKFTVLIGESRKNYDSFSLLKSEITSYINKVNKVIPKQVREVILLTQKYELLDSTSLEEIKNSTKSNNKELTSKYNLTEDQINELRKLLKDLKQNIRLLPQYQSASERQAIELGKLAADDLTIDLTTPQGRNAVAKKYMPVVMSIVNSYVGKSSMSKQELMSSALLGLTKAMNDWEKKDGNEEKKHVSFKTYMGYRVKYQILDDMNNMSHSLSGSNWYNLSKGLVQDTVSIDSIVRSNSDTPNQDRLSELGVYDTHDSKAEEEEMSNLYKIIENKFKSRDVDIFYRYFGLKGYKKEKSKDIAKAMGMSEGNIKNSIINKILSFLKNDPKSMDILRNLQDIYNESLMIDLIGLTNEEIINILSNDDMFLLLEELNRWSNKEVFISVVNNSLSYLEENYVNTIKNILSSEYDNINSLVKENKSIIKEFLKYVYPSDNIYEKSDSVLCGYIEELQNFYKKYIIL